MIKLLNVDNQSIKEMPINTWLEGRIIATNWKQHQHSSTGYLAIDIEWNHLIHRHSTHLRVLNSFLNRIGKETVEVIDGGEVEKLLEQLQPCINIVFGFRITAERYQGQIYNRIDGVISYAELGYQQALTR